MNKSNGGKTMYDPYAQFESTVMPNGLTVYAAQFPECPWEYMGFIIHSGAEQDPIGIEGLAHFVEHVVMNNGSVPVNEMQNYFKKHSGQEIKANTGHAYTKFRICVPTNNREIILEAVSMVSHMLLSAKIEKAIEHERFIIREEMRRKSGSDYFSTRKHKIMFPGLWLERSATIYGNPESLKSIKQSDLQSFYDKHYTPANISIVCVGNMNLSEITKMISDSHFAINKPGSRTPTTPIMTNLSRPTENGTIIYDSYGSTYRSYYKIPGNINETTVNILAEMLYEKLHEELREKNEWVYDVNVETHNFHCLYQLSIECSFSPEAADKIEHAVNEYVNSIESYVDIFEKVKQWKLINNSAKIRVTSINDVFNSAIDDLIDYQRIITLAEIEKDLENTTIQDIKELIKWLRPEMKWTYIIRPQNL